MTRRWCWFVAIALVIVGSSSVYCFHNYFLGVALGDRPVAEQTSVVADRPSDLSKVTVPTRSGSAADSTGPSPIRLRDATSSTAVDFEHSSAMSPHRYQPEAMGSGVAIVDLNSDGLMDLYFLTETPLPVDRARAQPRNKSYRARGDGSYTDISQPSGLDYNGFSHSVTTGDIDNDGFPELHLGCFGDNVLFRNNGDGTFTNVADCAQITAPGWGASSAFCDIDHDGDLDLYQARYCRWTIESHIHCGGPERSARTYCHPSVFQPEPHILFLNTGDGTFRDVTDEAGVRREDGRGLGVVAADLNDDGHIDLYVANDTTANFLFMNRGNGQFDDESEPSGAAYNLEGQGEASMGIDAEDVDGDGWPELFVTNFWMEHNTLYKNQNGRAFLDISMPSGLGPPSLAAMGWGTRLTDFDSDGWPDCFVTNGHLDNNLKDVGVHTPYRQRAQLWHNRGNGKFRHLRTEGGEYFFTEHVGRGAAFGDLNDDGYPDIVVSHLDEKPAILMNDSKRSAGEPNYWIRLSLIGVTANRDAIGAKVDIRVGPLKIRRQIKGGTSYLSAHDPRLLVGIGSHRRVESLDVTWPDGGKSLLIDLDAARSYRLREDTKP